MVRTSGAKDNNQRKRRKPTDAEKKQQQERTNATRREKARKEREAAERDRPAASFFQPHSVVQQQNNNDGNSDGIVDSAYVEGATKDNANHDGDGENNDDEQLNINDEHNEAVTIDFDTDSATNITHSDITVVLDVEEGEDDGRDEDDVDEDEDGNIINNNKNNEGTVMREVVEISDNVKLLTSAQEVNNAITAMHDEAKVKVIGLDAEWNVTLNSDNVKLLTSAQEVNNAITAMHDVAKVKVIGLDAEWNVTLNRHGYPTNTGNIALIQISYLDTSDNIVTLLIRTHKMKKLPHALETLLTRDTFKIVGVNVSADLIKIGKDFGINSILKVAQKDRPNVINLGPFARARDVVSSGTVSLQHLSERVLKIRLDKSSETRFSDWDQTELSEKQTKYAALYSIVSLEIFIEVDKMVPDLTRI